LAGLFLPGFVMSAKFEQVASQISAANPIQVNRDGRERGYTELHSTDYAEGFWLGERQR
jgi:hypothetical protein